MEEVRRDLEKIQPETLIKLIERISSGCHIRKRQIY